MKKICLKKIQVLKPFSKLEGLSILQISTSDVGYLNEKNELEWFRCTFKNLVTYLFKKRLVRPSPYQKIFLSYIKAIHLENCI